MLAHTTMSPVTAPIDSVICHGLQMELKDQLHEISSIQDVQGRELIFMEGDPSAHVFEVLEGVVLLSKLTADGRRQITGFVYPGELFGLGMGDQNSYTAETVTNTRLCRYPRKILDQSMNLYPALGRRFLDWTRCELTAAQNQMLLLGRKTAIEKIASFLLHLSERNEEHGEDPMRLFVPMTRSDIADYLGLTMETVSRTIGKLKQLGIIQLCEQSYINVRDLNRLINIADDEACFC